MESHTIELVANVPPSRKGFRATTLNSQGDLYCDWNNCVYVIKSAKKWMARVSGVPSTSIPRDGGCHEASFGLISDMEANDEYGRLYIADYTAHAIRMITGSDVVTLAGRLGSNGSRDGPSNFARFTGPTSVMRLFSRASLLVAELGSRYRLIDLSSGDVSTLEIDCEATPSFSTFKWPILRCSWTPGYPPSPEAHELVTVEDQAPNPHGIALIDFAAKQTETSAILPIGHFYPDTVCLYRTNEASGIYGVTSDYSDPQAPIVWYDRRLSTTRTPVFIPQTNTIVQWNSQHGELELIPNALPQAPGAPLLVNEQSRKQRFPLQLDYSSLIGSELPADLIFTHNLSHRVYYCHSRVLALNKGLEEANFEAICAALGDSPLPATSIDAFIHHLYFGKPASNDLVTLSHIAFLCATHGVDASKLLLHLHFVVLPTLPLSEIAKGLIECWISHEVTWTAQHQFIMLMTYFLRFTPHGGGAFMDIAFRLHATHKDRINVIVDLFKIPNPPEIADLINFETLNCGHYKLQVNWSSSTNPASLLTPNHYAIGISKLQKWTTVPGERLYAQWRYFKRLVDVHSMESKNHRPLDARRLRAWKSLSLFFAAVAMKEN